MLKAFKMKADFMFQNISKYLFFWDQQLKIILFIPSGAAFFLVLCSE